MQYIRDDDLCYLRTYNETSLAAKTFGREHVCRAVASPDNEGNIYVWTHSGFIDSVVYYPFQYTSKNVHTVQMVYSAPENQYVRPIYYGKDVQTVKRSWMVQNT